MVVTTKIVIVVAAVSGSDRIASAVALATSLSKGVVLVQAASLESLPLPGELDGQLLLLANRAEKYVGAVVVAELAVDVWCYQSVESSSRRNKQEHTVFDKLIYPASTVKVISIIAATASAEDLNIFLRLLILGGISRHGSHARDAGDGGDEDFGVEHLDGSESGEGRVSKTEDGY